MSGTGAAEPISLETLHIKSSYLPPYWLIVRTVSNHNGRETIYTRDKRKEVL